MEGLIVKGIGGFYTVKDMLGAEYTLRAQGKLRRQRMTPRVGDRVVFSPGNGEEYGWLTEIMPRKNVLVRPPVANIDKMVLTVSAGSPKADLLLIDRLLLLCYGVGIEPVLAVNKVDQDAGQAREIMEQYAPMGIVIFELSAQEGIGIEPLRLALKGFIHAFGGQSGVGKSTLINALYGLTLETGSLSAKIERGKHTTRHCELISVPGGGMVLDTPGFSLLESDAIEPGELKKRYPEFLPYDEKCRFLPCMHYKEPDCAVKQAVEAGKIHPLRHERYVALLEEMNERWQKRYD